MGWWDSYPSPSSELPLTNQNFPSYSMFSNGTQVRSQLNTWCWHLELRIGNSLTRVGYQTRFHTSVLKAKITKSMKLHRGKPLHECRTSATVVKSRKRYT